MRISADEDKVRSHLLGSAMRRSDINGKWKLRQEVYSVVDSGAIFCL